VRAAQAVGVTLSEMARKLGISRQALQKMSRRWAPRQWISNLL